MSDAEIVTLTLLFLLYVLGWGWTYTILPLVYPISCDGPTGPRFALSFLWPVMGFMAWLGIAIAGSA